MRKLSRYSISALAILLLSSGLVSTATAQDGDKLAWSVSPYIWASDTLR